MTSAFRYYEDEECQALDLPYKGDNLSMLVLLPKVVLETPDLVDKYNTVTDNLRYESEVILSLPRFKLTTNYKLGDTLKKLGAEVAFSDAADFSGIGDDALKISEVIHKAFVQCDEEGTEAAAATVVGMVRMTSMIQPRPPKVFNVNHPFVFFICNKKSGNVLFCGRVTNPGE